MKRKTVHPCTVVVLLLGCSGESDRPECGDHRPLHVSREDGGLFDDRCSVVGLGSAAGIEDVARLGIEFDRTALMHQKQDPLKAIQFLKLVAFSQGILHAGTDGDHAVLSRVDLFAGHLVVDVASDSAIHRPDLLHADAIAIDLRHPIVLVVEAVGEELQRFTVEADVADLANEHRRTFFLGIGRRLLHQNLSGERDL